MAIQELWRGQIHTVTNLPFPRPGTPVEIEIQGEEASICLVAPPPLGDRPSNGKRSLRGSRAAGSKRPQPTIEGDYSGLGRFELIELDSRTPRGRKFQCTVYGVSPRGGEEGEVEIGCWVADDDGDGKRSRSGGGESMPPR